MSYANTIAIDGPSAAGKSTIALQLAQRLCYLYFDTGVMYRAVTLAALERGIAIGDEEAITRLANEVDINVCPPTENDGRQYTVYLDGRDVTWDLRRPDVERGVSPVAAYPGVRTALTVQQREIARRGQVIMVGRDIGTVVLPEAELKVYLDASVETRAQRRYLESVQRGMTRSYEEVLQDMRRRDKIDSEREAAPLRPADDAIIVDTTDMTIPEVVEAVLKLVEERQE